jgi:hypothetical protein
VEAAGQPGVIPDTISAWLDPHAASSEDIERRETRDCHPVSTTPARIGRC